MSEEVRANIPTGPNGERMAIQIGTKSVAITSRDLISVLLVIVMGVGFYLTVLSLTHNQDRGFQQQTVGFQKLEKLLEVAHTNQTAILTALQSHRDATWDRLDKHQAVVVEQLHLLGGTFLTFREDLERWFADMEQRQELMNFNTLHPEQALPLRGPPPPEAVHPERRPPR